jgi:trigger factor
LQLQTSALPGSRLELTFSLEGSEVESVFAKVFNELSQGAAIPGFRKGHAPAHIIRRRTKPEMLRDMAWMRLMEEYVEKELQKEELQVIGEPDFPNFDEIELLEGQPVTFTLTVTVRPKPELPDYSGLKLYRIAAEVSDEQVAEVIEQMREAAGQEVAVEGRDVVEKGDLAEAEVNVLLEGAEEASHVSTQTFEVGSGRYQPAIDEALVGHQVGETVEVPVDYPEDHEVADLAGKQGTIRATIQGLKTKVLPELNDEFAQGQGEYEDLADLQAKMREKLQADAERSSRDTLDNDALGIVVRDTVVDMPEALVHNIAARGYQSFLQDLQREGLSLENFLEITGADESALQRNELVRAEIGLKVDLVLEAVAEAEGVEVGDEAIEEEMALFGAENNLEVDFLRNAMGLQEGFREQLEGRAQRRLTLQALLAKADIEDVSRERYDEIKAEERQARETEAAAKAAEEAAAEEPAEAETAADTEPETTEESSE